MKKYEAVKNALEKLTSIQDDMLILTLEGKLDSNDFRSLMSLAEQLKAMLPELAKKGA